MTLTSALQALYDREINCGLGSFWDQGYRVWIGDDMNGIKAERWFDASKLDEAAKWLFEEAERLNPSAG
jgi:hypothetical protein